MSQTTAGMEAGGGGATLPHRGARRRTVTYLMVLVALVAIGFAARLYVQQTREELNNTFDASALPAMPTDGSGPTAMGASGAGGAPRGARPGGRRERRGDASTAAAAAATAPE